MPKKQIRTLAELDADEKAAWSEYLETTQELAGKADPCEVMGDRPLSYEDVEAWAWARLRATLAGIKRQRKRVLA